jgi:hypothetical protein
MSDWSKQGADFDAHVGFRCPTALAETIEQAAARDMTTPSAYARQAIVKQLRRDGINPSQLVTAAA